MKGIILFLTVCFHILCHLMVGANILQFDSTDNEKVEKTCDVILNFSNVGFTQIGSNFISSLYVKNLSLCDNAITIFEKGAFDSLPNLEYLDVSRNKLSLSELFSFGGHSNLKTLIMDYSVNDLEEHVILSNKDDKQDFIGITTSTSKPTEKPHQPLTINPFYYFPELEHLSLKGINIGSLSAYLEFNFPKLKYIDLSENNFYEPAINVYNNIPLTISHLVMEKSMLEALRSRQFKNISQLNVNNNYFEKISNQLCTGKVLCLQEMYNLNYLSVSNCAIQVIDSDAFKDTTSMLKLDISNNYITDLPNEIFHYIPSLIHFDLSFNNINAMPDFSVLRNLSSLELNGMQNKTIFDSLSSFSYMPNLKSISMRQNMIRVIPQSFFENLPVLQEIDLSFNLITSLPPFSSQKFLRQLTLSDNLISNISDLSFKNVESLKYLDLRYNIIKGIKIGTLQMLPTDAVLYT